MGALAGSRARFGVAIAVAAFGIAVTTSSCGGDGAPSSVSAGRHPLMTRILSDRPAPAADTIEVWVCDVPADTMAPRYGRLPLRQALTPDGLVEAIGERVTAFFTTVSDGAYRPRFRAGGTVQMSASDDDEDCVETALDRSSTDTDVVLAVATAEHVEASPGGWGRPGTWATCQGSCPARTTRRAAYVGASDFHPDWGDVPLLDLIEHEIGHTLGLPHSGSPEPGSDEYRSALDLMSDSAAPRAVDPTRRDAPPPIAMSRLDLGWIDAADARELDAAGAAGAVTLVPSTAASGTRLVVLPALPFDEHRVVTLEFLVPDGYLDHMPGAGVAVHVVDDRAGGGIQRVHDTVGTPPFTDLSTEGESLRVEGWEIRVVRLTIGDGSGEGSWDGSTVDLAITPITR